MNNAKLHLKHKTYILSLFDGYYLQTTTKPSMKDYSDVEIILNAMHEGDDTTPSNDIEFYTTFNGVKVAPSTIRELLIDTL